MKVLNLNTGKVNANFLYLWNIGSTKLHPSCSLIKLTQSTDSVIYLVINNIKHVKTYITTHY